MIIIIAIDETDGWELDDLGTKIKAIWGIYLLDDQEATYAAETIPSFACHFVESAIILDDKLPASEREKIYGDLADADVSEAVTYFHCSRIDALPDSERSPTEFEDLKEAEEYYRCNTVDHLTCLMEAV